MAQPSRVEPERADEPAEGARVLELLRRIEALEALPESAFGRFTRWDWLACTLLALILPGAVLLWFGRGAGPDDDPQRRERSDSGRGQRRADRSRTHAAPARRARVRHRRRARHLLRLRDRDLVLPGRRLHGRARGGSAGRRVPPGRQP